MNKQLLGNNGCDLLPCDPPCKGDLHEANVFDADDLEWVFYGKLCADWIEKLRANKRIVQ